MRYRFIEKGETLQAGDVLAANVHAISWDQLGKQAGRESHYLRPIPPQGWSMLASGDALKSSDFGWKGTTSGRVRRMGKAVKAMTSVVTGFFLRAAGDAAENSALHPDMHATAEAGDQIYDPACGWRYVLPSEVGHSTLHPLRKQPSPKIAVDKDYSTGEPKKPQETPDNAEIEELRATCKDLQSRLDLAIKGQKELQAHLDFSGKFLESCNEDRRQAVIDLAEAKKSATRWEKVANDLSKERDAQTESRDAVFKRLLEERRVMAAQLAGAHRVLESVFLKADALQRDVIIDTMAREGA